MVNDRKRIIDRQLSFERGCDTGRAPDRIGDNQVALLVNGTCRGDRIGLRPGLRQHTLKFSDQNVQTGFETGYFQGHKPFIVPGQNPMYHVSISGRIFRIDLVQLTVSEVALPDPNPTAKELVWFEQVQKTHVYQDGESVPLLITTGGAQRSDVQGKSGTVDTKPKNQVPTGRAMSYANARLTVCLADGVSYVVSDIAGGPTGPLYFTENNFLATDGTFSLPSNMGEITSIAPLANLDSTLGQSNVQLFTNEGAVSFNAPFDRTTWQSLTYPISTVSLLGSGPRSDYSVVNVNGDKWYRTDDGINSFIVGRRDMNMWGQTAMSHEVSLFIENDAENLLDRSAGALYQQWLIQTCKPQFDPLHGVYHMGLVALDFTPITAIGIKEPPAWDGMWTGQKFLQLSTVKVKGKQRCFVFILSATATIQLWELDASIGYDLLADGTKQRIRRAIEFKRLSAGNPKELKILDGFELWISELKGTVDFNLFYRPDQYATWFPWQSAQECASECSTEACATGDQLNLQPQYRPRMSFQQPPVVCETGNSNPSDHGYQFQARLEITGECIIESYTLVMRQADEDIWGPCPPTVVSVCPASISCGEDNILTSV